MNRVRVLSLFLLLAGVTAHAQQPRQVEYFFDTDPGYGLGAVISNLKIGGNTLTFDLSAAKDGAHVLYVRSQDDTGLWSTTMSRPLFIDCYQDIVYVEYFYDDNDPGLGKARSLPLPDVDYKGHLEFSADFDLTGLSLGQHLLTVRALDRYEQWSDAMTRSFTIVRNGNVPDPPAPPIGAGDLARIEYFFDVDPGYGLGRALTTPNVGTNTYSMSFEGLLPGAHVVYLRAWDDHNNWSQTISRPVYVCSVKGLTAHRLEYFFDTDPGYGNAVALQSPALGESSIVLPLYDIQPGAHVLNLRVQNEQGRWSTVLSRPLYICQPSGEVVALEYFFDNNDPGEGRATAVQLPGNLKEPFAFDIAISGLSAGQHQLNVRAAGDNGLWSLVHSEPFTVVDDGHTGIKSATRLLPVSISATKQACILTAEEGLKADCQVDVVSVSGVRVASQVWPTGQSSLTIPLNVASGTVLIVNVSDRKNQLRIVQRMIAK